MPRAGKNQFDKCKTKIWAPFYIRKLAAKKVVMGGKVMPPFGVRLRSTIFGRTYRQTLHLTDKDMRSGAILGSGKFQGHDVSDFAKMMIGMTLPKVIRGMVSPDAKLFGFKLKPRIHKGWLKFNT